ncbi:hypothetical protein SAMN05443287_102554 [Micromonospora phaseoli]|uniref:Peptidase inhibitor family I36 n=1 Tax=Micromonospora phaseoli TaxID=1144548 RepID=A0A1H6VDV7_9ACTN|nr:hypothetical protein [Micromonospora phaseoli]PZV93693.1 hypothetical protein CLV64_109152 [Micromonospora phaseoli]GIJ79173.1 hypothetical protein Xph01_36050 [Micromonospora phaseoli]SEJ00027.1 hypothetical protein SAMN05443287_102554 [Micromonospora phaseoli]
MKRLAGMVALVAVLIVGGGWAVPAQAAPIAAAANCPTVRALGSTATPTWVAKSPRAPVWSGPASACDVIDYVDFHTVVYMWCSWLNPSTGNWWTYTNWGWIYNGNLAGGLDDDRCRTW